MEGLLSLIGLAGASGGLLYAANQQHKKGEQTRSSNKKKEGFSVVHESVATAFPPEHSDFIEESAKQFNPLMNSLDPRMNPLLPANYTPSDVRNAQKNIREAVRATLAKAADPSYNLHMNSLASLQVYGPEETKKVRALGKCESIKTVDCNAFNDPIFAKNCGICHVAGKNSQDKDHIGGLLITKTDIEAAQTRADRMGDRIPTYQPSVGSCTAERFSITKQQCQRIQAQVDCESKQNFDVKGCSQCVQTGRFNYIDAAVQKMGVTVVLVGQGNARIQAMVAGATPEVVTLSGVPHKVDFNLESDTALVISVDGIERTVTIPPATPEGKSTTKVIKGPVSLAGYIVGKIPSGGEYRVDLSKLAEMDAVTGRKPRPGESVAINGEGFVMMNGGVNQTNMNVNFYIPYTFFDASDKDIKKYNCPAPYITSQRAADKMNSGPCFTKGSGPGNYSLECLQNTFEDAGCTPAGSGYPSNATKATALMRGGKSLNQIASSVYEQSVKAVSSQNQEERAAAMDFCLGKKMAGPCDLNPTTGPLSDECIAYLYNNMGASSSIGPTYTGSGQCTTQGSASPIKKDGSYNGGAVEKAKAAGGIIGVKKYFNDLQLKASDNSLTDEVRAPFVEACYGIKFSSGSGGFIPVPESAKRLLSGSVPGAPSGNQLSGIPNSFTLRAGNKIGTVMNYGDYTLKFTIIPKGIIGSWGSILHFTTDGGNCCAPGQRIPGIWFTPGGLGLHMRIGDMSDGNWGWFDTDPLILGKPNTVVVEATGSTVRMTINGKVYGAKQPTKRPSGKAEVWAGDQYHPPANAIISDISFVSVAPAPSTLPNVIDSPLSRQVTRATTYTPPAPPRKFQLYGPWIGPPQDVTRVDQLANGKKVYMIFHDNYTKMVSENGQAKYYVGRPEQFSAAKWNTYSDAGKNYRLRVV